MTEVVITAFGCCTPIGSSYQTIKDALISGVSGVRKILKYDTSGFRSQFAGVPIEGNERIKWSTKGSSIIGDIFYTHLAVNNLKKHPGFPHGEYDPHRIGCFIGADEPVPDMQQTINLIYDLVKNQNGGLNKEEIIERHFRISDFFNYDPTVTLNKIAKVIPFTGPAVCHLGLCSASLQAIGIGYESIRNGRIDAAVVGGVSAKITQEHYLGLEASDVISTDNTISPEKRSRPFDLWRSGYIPAEGSVLFMLERRSQVEKRGNRESLLEILGYGSSQNAYHVVKPDEESREMILSMTRAIKDANIKPEEIDLVNAHGTSTILNDIHESIAINTVLGKKVRVTANKSIHGHMIAAAGAMETLNTLISCRDKFIPGSINVERQDPKCPINLITKTVWEQPKIVLKNSFGMGGLAASIIFRACY